MKWLTYSQYLYFLAGCAFFVSVIYKFITNQDFGLQAIIAAAFIIMFFVRRKFVKRLEKHQKNQ
ncbi:MAG: hypothetical protein RLY43_2096 [Bacteroidota bacterium]|jgi:membrane protein implicated in regulation of membrane protease activity|nr:hypothetical protein [uncultured Flavobacterium sp.]